MHCLVNEEEICFQLWKTHNDDVEERKDEFNKIESSNDVVLCIPITYAAMVETFLALFYR